MSNIILRTFEGTHYETGFQQGRVVRDLIHKALEEMSKFETIKLLKPKLLPTRLFLALAKRRAAKLLTKDIFQYYPKQAQRLQGVAEGAEIDISTALFLQSMELLIGNPKFRLEACTSLGFSPPRTTTAETIVAKNLDYINELAPYQLTCETRPKEGYKTLGCKMAPLPGMLEGMNEHGLTVTYNSAYTTEKPSCFAPLSIVLQELLENCKDTEEAVKFLLQAKRGGHDAILMLADSEGNIKTVEISSNHAATREMKNNQIINTNHYLTAEMQQYEIPHNAVYLGEASLRIHESSEQRLQRAEQLLKDKTKIDESKIAAILRDHGKDSKPSMLTICRHDKYASTLRSMIFYPSRKTIKILYGNPCQNEYTEFTF